MCERFHGTALHDFFRVAFHAEVFTSLTTLDARLQAWVDRYNRVRSDYMRGRSPLQVLQQHQTIVTD